MKLAKDQVESLRYVNHLWPVLVLRFYVSYFFFSSYYKRIHEGFLTQPKLSASIDEFLYSSQPPRWIESFFVDYVQENWSLAAHVLVNLEWILGLLFLIGFLNRPSAVVGLLSLYLMTFVSSPVEVSQFLPIATILLTLFLFGSGRVGGVDYFFYKRQRGLIW